MHTYFPGHSRPVGIGIYLPEKVVTSESLMRSFDCEKRFGVSAQWLERVVGVRERRVAEPGAMPSDLATKATLHALENSGVDPRDIGLIIFCGIERDYAEPSTAHVVQHHIGARGAFCFDVSNACHGFVNGLHIADQMLAAGNIEHALICTGELPTEQAMRGLERLKREDSKDAFRATVGTLSVGDSGAAMIMTRRQADEPGFVGFHLASDGDHFDLCVCGDRRDPDRVFMHMGEISKHGIKLHKSLFKDTMRHLGWQASDVAFAVHHQVGRKVYEAHSAYSGIDVHRMPTTIASLGNLTTSSIPVNLYMLWKSGRARTGDKVLIGGAGSGLSVSQCGLIWDQLPEPAIQAKPLDNVVPFKVAI